MSILRQGKQSLPDSGQLFGGGNIDPSVGGQSQVGDSHALGGAAADQQNGGVIRVGVRWLKADTGQGLLQLFDQGNPVIAGVATAAIAQPHLHLMTHVCASGGLGPAPADPHLPR